MSLPLAMTTITVTRDTNAATEDPYDSTPNIVQVVSGVRAVISPPGGAARLVGGTRIVYDAKLDCDVCDLQTEDTVTDDKTGISWTVLPSSLVTGVGLIFTTASLRRVTGAT